MNLIDDTVSPGDHKSLFSVNVLEAGIPKTFNWGYPKRPTNLFKKMIAVFI